MYPQPPKAFNLPEKQAASTILVADDNASDLKFINFCLKEHGYRTAVATSGKIALERTRRIHPDLVLLDVMMPDLKGFEVCRELKKDPATSDIPVIFMTALASVEDKIHGFQAGAVDYITKPIYHEELLARLHIHLQIQQLTQNLQAYATELERVNDELLSANNKIKVLNRQLTTENIRISKDLQTSRRKYLTLAGEMSDGYVVLEEGRIVFANQAFCEMHGYSAEEMLEHDFVNFIVPEDRTNVSELYAYIEQETSDTHVFEYHGIRRDADEITIEMKIKVTSYEDTPIIIGICRDITERIKMQAKMQETERMAAIGRLTTSLSHELRNPLAAIKMNLQVLKKFHPFEGDDLRCMELSLNEVMRLENILTDLLDFAKPLHLNFSSCSLNTLLEQCLELLRIRFEEKQVHIVRNMASYLPKIQADQEKLSQVILNLLLNAFEISRPHQTIRVSTCYYAEACTPRVEMGIEDEGPGISEKLRERIFHPFFSTKEKGTGIGLTNVKHIVEAHQGKVETVNCEPRGALFRVWFPV